MPCGGQNEMGIAHDMRFEAGMVGRPNGDGRTCMVRRGTVSAVHGCGALLARRLAMGEPRGTGDAGGGSC